MQYSTLVGDSVDLLRRSLVVLPDDTALTGVGSKTLSALDGDGRPSWTFELKPGAQAPDRQSWITADPVTDQAGNVYIVGIVPRGGSGHTEVHAVKLGQKGKVLFDTVLDQSTPKRLTHTYPPMKLVAMPNGELVLLLQEKDGGIGQEYREHLVVLDPAGRVARDFVSSVDDAGGRNIEDQGGFRRGQIHQALDPFAFQVQFQAEEVPEDHLQVLRLHLPDDVGHRDEILPEDGPVQADGLLRPEQAYWCRPALLKVPPIMFRPHRAHTATTSVRR